MQVASVFMKFLLELNILQIFHPKLHATKQKFPTASSPPANRNFQFQNMKLTKKITIQKFQNIFVGFPSPQK